jgi:hypothetical protein
MRLIIFTTILILFFACSSSIAKPLTNITNKHNLSSTSSNTVRASTDTRICVFCHTPHGASAQSALWNRKNPTTVSFNLYNDIAGTLNIDDPAIVPLSQYDKNLSTYPNGATRMCLSCHDGVSAVGEVLTGLENFTSKIAMTYNTLGDAPGSAGVVSLDTSHPVSFIYSTAVKSAINSAEGVLDDVNYKLPTVVPLDSFERMQCTTCHDPHEDTRTLGGYSLPFWRNYSGNDVTDYDNTCKDCHLGGTEWGGTWGPSPAPTSPKTLHSLP